MYLISHGRSIFAHIQVGCWVAVGGGGEAAKQGKYQFTAKRGRLFANCRPHRPLSTFCLKQKMQDFKYRC
jgi:hypothetical protein